MTTINDVAKLAGVSKSTVSHVFNSTKYTSDAIKERVYQAAKALDYESNYFAKTLATNKSKVIGMRLDSDHEFFNAFQQRVVEGMLQACLAKDYYLLMIPIFRSKKEFFPVDGMILMNPSIDDLCDETVPHVWLGKPADLKKSPYYVDSNNEAIMTDLVETLIDYNHQSILFINANKQRTVSHTRAKAFIKALLDAGMTNSQANQCHINCLANYDPAAYAAQEFLDLYDDLKPDAVIVDNDYMAQGIYRVAQSLKLSIPEDLSVVAVSESLKSSEVFTPALSYIELNEVGLGRETANLLFDIIEGKPLKSNIRFVEGKLRINGSISMKEG